MQPNEQDVVALIPHASVHEWIRPHLLALRPIPIAYWCVNLLLVAYVVRTCLESGRSFWDSFSLASLSMVVAFVVLLPVHEGLHALAYRSVGARSVRVQYLWRQLSARCTAPGFIADGEQFIRVCLTPMLVLTPVLAVLTAAAAPGTARMAAAAALLLHTGACSGDVALVQFVRANGGRELLTCDDEIRAITYFWRRTARLGGRVR